MLTQDEANLLLDMLKLLINKGLFKFPSVGQYETLDLVSESGKEKFIIDINRKGFIKISKCTYQERYQKEEILLRLDIDGPAHTNPDGRVISSNHIHIYREGFGDAWAFSIPDVFTDTSDLINTLIEFLEYCKVTNIEDLSIQGGML